MHISRRPTRRVVVRTSKVWSRVIARSRPEGLRWLRSDGSPNWSQRVSSRVGEVGVIASKPPIVVHKASTVMEAIDLIGSHRVRGLPVVEFGKLVGVLSALDLVNYLGGGEYYNIVVKRYEGNIFKALEERVFSISNTSPTAVRVSDRIDSVIELMIGRGLGFLPIIDNEGAAVGVITEHDMVKFLAEKETGVKVSDVATTTLVTVNLDEPLKNVVEKMVRHGFRRLIALSGDTVEGAVSAKSYVSFFSSRRAFSFLKSTNIEDMLAQPASQILEKEYIVVEEDMDVGEVSEHLLKSGLNWALVARGDEVIGLITEKDILVALALEGVPG